MPLSEMMGQPGGGNPADAAGAPVGSPMATPQQNEGLQQSAMVDISMAQDLLEKSLGPFGSETEKGRALLSALQTLSKAFGETRQKSRDLQGAEISQLMQSLPAAGGASPEMKAMAGGGAPQPMPQAA